MVNGDKKIIMIALLLNLLQFSMIATIHEPNPSLEDACMNVLAMKEPVFQHDFVILDTPPVEIAQLLFRDSSELFCNRLYSNLVALIVS